MARTTDTDNDAPQPDAPDLAARRAVSMPVGVVVRRRPGVTRWARWSWRPIALLPGAGVADWRELRREGQTVDYHAATVPLTLYRGETEAYRVALSESRPCLFVILRKAPADAAMPWQVHLVTASPHEAALFETSGEEIVEKLEMPTALAGWVGNWIAAHHVEEPFVKRKRRPHRDRDHGAETPRAAQAGNVYRAPTADRHAAGDGS
ncbi:hypothetical protein ROJ8625_03868 [Roseivivax jejudonensis]|uniref:Molybdopterin-guanine dinucleotide biosynthesis protein A n=1 Tax=Roseivivax jejudonensis TaxID=1529041 RepID=A0A1X7A7Y8_9RHOB|nr:DUF3305 domain-containing protein [Roseivivax jejudonensis]SLN72692.1 hypothetical protein ROJ8625_03868 [Roseivivax jejudonensis]